MTETVAEFTACPQQHRRRPAATDDGTRAIRTVHGTLRGAVVLQSAHCAELACRTHAVPDMAEVQHSSVRPKADN